MKRKLFQSLHDPSFVVEILFYLHLTIGFLAAAVIVKFYPELEPFWVAMAWSLILVSLLVAKVMLSLDRTEKRRR